MSHRSDTRHPPRYAEKRVLGLADLGASAYDEYWLWCRRHKQSVKSGFRCNDGGWPTHWFPLDGCIRIGPFMSEREANRLTGNQPAGYGAWALGMEVE